MRSGKKTPDAKGCSTNKAARRHKYLGGPLRTEPTEYLLGIMTSTE